MYHEIIVSLKYIVIWSSILSEITVFLVKDLFNFSSDSIIWFFLNFDAFSTNNGKDVNNDFLTFTLQSNHNEFDAILHAQSATIGAKTAQPKGDNAETFNRKKMNKRGISNEI